MADKKIQDFTAEASPAAGDFFLMSRASDEGYRKVTKANIVPGTTNYLGSACDGSSGDANRGLDITSGTPVIVVVDGVVIQPTYGYTYATTTITFLNKIWDDQQITVWK